MERGLRRNRNVAFGSKRVHETLVSFASSAAALRGTQRGFYLDLIGQLDGFEGVDSYGGGGGWALVVDGPDGTLRKRVDSMDPSVRANGAIQANDPTGGVIVFADSSSPRPRLIAFDPAGAVRWNVEVAATMGAAFGVDRMGNALLLFDGGSLFSAGTTAGQWVDHAGTPGAIFDAKVA